MQSNLLTDPQHQVIVCVTKLLLMASNKRGLMCEYGHQGWSFLLFLVFEPLYHTLH